MIDQMSHKIQLSLGGTGPVILANFKLKCDKQSSAHRCIFIMMTLFTDDPSEQFSSDLRIVTSILAELSLVFVPG